MFTHMQMTPVHLVIAAVAAFLAGGINSVAGGGTLVTFPTLMALGLPPVIANATNTVAIWPGTVGSLWGFRREFAQTETRMRWLVIPSVIGGAAGALLLRITPPNAFEKMVPFLVLFATVIFTARAPIQRLIKSAHPEAHRTKKWFVIGLVFQMLVGLYGGYFGAGISIMMLSALSIFGMTDMLQMNALTSLFSLCINGVAALLFIWASMVYWPYVLVMAIGSILGGYGAAGLARKIGGDRVRVFVLVVGYAISALLFVKMLR
ncbi:sulfite exporter TauE/SafE family protein [Candidatus Korobacter versatilis]|nr:sulfite exporter TauE/SafE family protein [Candidatus Koribacter versatilis]